MNLPGSNSKDFSPQLQMIEKFSSVCYSAICWWKKSPIILGSRY